MEIIKKAKKKVKKVLNLKKSKNVDNSDKSNNKETKNISDVFDDYTKRVANVENYSKIENNEEDEEEFIDQEFYNKKLLGENFDIVLGMNPFLRDNKKRKEQNDEQQQEREIKPETKSEDVSQNLFSKEKKGIKNICHFYVRTRFKNTTDLSLKVEKSLLYCRQFLIDQIMNNPVLNSEENAPLKDLAKNIYNAIVLPFKHGDVSSFSELIAYQHHVRLVTTLYSEGLLKKGKIRKDILEKIFGVPFEEIKPYIDKIAKAIDQNYEINTKILSAEELEKLREKLGLKDIYSDISNRAKIIEEGLYKLCKELYQQSPDVYNYLRENFINIFQGVGITLNLPETIAEFNEQNIKNGYTEKTVENQTVEDIAKEIMKDDYENNRIDKKTYEQANKMLEIILSKIEKKMEETFKQKQAFKNQKFRSFNKKFKNKDWERNEENKNIQTFDKKESADMNEQQNIEQPISQSGYRSQTKTSCSSASGRKFKQ